MDKHKSDMMSVNDPDNTHIVDKHTTTHIHGDTDGGRRVGLALSLLT